MTDYLAQAPQITHAQREKEGFYQRFLSWLSMSKPGLWRLRIDIMVMNYIVLGFAALSAPVLLQPFAGPDESSYCAPGVDCAGTASFYVNGNSESYTWLTGYSTDDVMLATFLFALGSFILTAIWAFFVSRGTRLRGLVVQSSFPGFIVVVLVLLPMVILPLIAGVGMFIFTHGGGLSTVLTGVTEITTDAGLSREFAFAGRRHYGDMMSNDYSALLLIGTFCSFVVAISMKIILADGVMGLVKSIIISGILGALTVVIGLFVFPQGISYGTLLQLSLLSGFGFLYYMWFRLSLIRNRRSKLSRTIGLSFCMYTIGWYPLIVLYTIVGFDLDWDWHPVVVSAVVAFIYAIFLSITFRDISRINMLPQP